MTTEQTNPTTPPTPLRLWPGIGAVVLQWLAWAVLPVLAPAAAGLAIPVAVAAGLVVVVWWLFFSRAPWLERLGALALMVVAVIAVRPFVHPSIANAFMGRMLYVYSIPIFCLSLVAALVATRRLGRGPRRISVAAAILLGCATFTLLRTGGITGNADSDLHWRWTQTPEERLLAEAGDEPAAPPPPPPVTVAAATPAATPSPAAVEAPGKPPSPAAAEPPAVWPGFRGPNRDAVIRGVQIESDWSKSPPALLWRRKVGPAWSSFAVRGDVVYTQEQRGEHEVVAAYRLASGAPVWRHRDPARFWESNGGAGPRGTPAVGNGRVYTLGATGIVNALDAGSGAVVWSRNAASDTGAPTPGWGFTGSPLVVGDVVIVAVSGRLAAYEAATGAPRWTLETGGGSYSSPHLMTLGGVTQVLMPSSVGVTAVAPADGARLWDHAWPGTTILQPAGTPDGDVLVAIGDMMGGAGTRRLAIAHGPSGWNVQERWTSTGLKPYFNDFVVHGGYAYGFDGSILACIDLSDGGRKWKGGRYGNGQLILLPDQDLLLVLSEEGELALVSATPGTFTEVARVPAIEGKTWNHPALAGDVLLVRNGEEMAAFRLSRAAP